ncbi:hypothetical protein MBLNU459_g5790t1 [Dothideomycetes sp. NU459]
MPAMTATTPLREGTEKTTRTESTLSFVPPRSQSARPASEATEFVETDFEDDESEFEEYSPKGSFDSSDSRRRSQTTISSYDEAPTPQSERARPFEVLIKPVEGPRGPHLFRASQMSADFVFDHALQLSPLDIKQGEEPPRTETAFSQETVVPRRLNRADWKSSSPIDVDVWSWSTEQVLAAMDHLDVPHEVIAKLQKHDISGQILMNLKFEDLKELEIESFGKRHQLWNVILTMRGGEKGPSPTPTPFQDISRPCTNVRSKSDGDIPVSACSDTPISENATPVTPLGGHKRRRGKKHRRHDDVIEPGESVSIVAIEQVMPKPHSCGKGENCPKYRKQQRLIRRIQEEQLMGGSSWPISPTKGGHIVVMGNPGNAQIAENVLPNVHRKDRQEDTNRPVSEAVPSVVASSDLLGPGQLPAFALHEDMLQRLEHRDPQDNVKQFLNFQHVPTAPVEEPQTPPLEMFPEQHHQMFPPQQQQLYPSMQPPRHTPGPPESLKMLPRLAIPRSASANPYLGVPPRPFTPADSILSSCRSATASPGSVLSPNANLLYRYGTPASELDVPITALPIDPVGTRNTSQSVPPNMEFRQPTILTRSHSRAGEWRRPSFALPKLQEDEVFSSTTAVPPSSFPVVDKEKQKEMKKSRMQQQFGEDTQHAGWMKKRKTRLLRHEWQDAHFRLRGTQLAMHVDHRLSSAQLDSFDVDDYAVACSSVSHNSKISAALKSLKIGSKDEKRAKEADAAAFNFQLVPEERDRRHSISGKTHHFMVRTSDERIDWMRELMLAKALRQKQSGFAVEVNGQKA